MISSGDCCGDHPRVCGEEFNGMTDDELQEGSPPRMRGRASFFSSCFGCSGITPAYAGKSSTLQCELPVPGDHPRVCGEEFMPYLMQGLSLGSPPRMRGRVIHHCEDFQQNGITPAYAGKSLQEDSTKLEPRDHPRVCGEERCECRWSCPAPGSPPRMRGRD